MKITIYELLGMVKDGKVPKKIKYDDRIFEFDELEEQYCYHNEDYTINEDLNCHIDGLKKTILNDTVEILEEEKKIPEKIKSNGEEFYCDNIDSWIDKEKTSAYCEYLMNKYNDLIDYLKSKGV